MKSATQNIFEQALHLKPVERAELIDKLFHSFDKGHDEQIDARWAVEAESRIDAFDAGQISSDSADAVFERINKR